MERAEMNLNEQNNWQNKLFKLHQGDLVPITVRAYKNLPKKTALFACGLQAERKSISDPVKIAYPAVFVSLNVSSI